MDQQDGVYNRRPWDYVGPFANTTDQRISEALSVNSIPGDKLSALVRPPLPQVKLFPPRFGYRSRQLGIEDVIDVDQIYQMPDPAGGHVQPGYEGTSRNTQGSGSW